MRKNQKGFTLVELIIAVAILAIVTAAVCGFIVVGSRSYASSNTDIMLQQDAQLALNQMSDVIIDTTDSISYGLGTSGSGEMQLVLKDSEFAGEATEKCLIVVNRKEDDSNNDNPSYWFYWSKDDEVIYFNEVKAYSSSMSADQIENEFKNAGTDKAILAQHVTDFSIDISQFEANRVVMISMTFENGNRTYSTSNNVTVRNRIALNEITVGPMKRAEDFEINTVRNVTMEPGEPLNLGGLTQVVTNSDKDALTWELADGEQNGTTLDKNTGYLSVGIGETRTSFKVRVSRAEEEYTGQNDRVAQTITVNVKRATSVKFNGPTTAKQGDTVSLTAWADGNMLTQFCNGHVGSPDVTKDREVNAWKIVEGDENAEIVTSDNGSATVLIRTTAQAGAKIVIRAESVLSKTPGREYGLISNPTTSPVWGEHVIMVEKKASDTVAMPGSFRFGEDNDDILSWLKQGITKGTASEYVVYARVKDIYGGQPDRVAIYYTNMGENIRFYPDMFGLELNRSYKLFLQAILPVPNSRIDELVATTPGNRDFSGEVHKYDNEIVDEIINHPENLDSEGKYIGTKFDYGFYYEGSINPPVISMKYNGVSYPNNDKDYYESYSLLSTRDTVIGSINLDQNGIMNIDARSINGKVFLGIYKGEGSDVGDWEIVAGYDPSIGTLGGYIMNNGSYNFTNTEMFYLNVQQSGNPLLTNDNFFKRRTNISDSNAIGTYHIVAGYIYANQEQLTGRNFKFLYRNYMDVADFTEHFYLQPDCAITLKVDAKLNLNLIYGGESHGWIDYPLPTNSSFPFKDQTEAEREQKDWNSYDIYTTQNGAEKTGNSLSQPTVKCTYDSSTGSYRIQLMKVEEGPKAKVVTDYGTYEWRPGYTEWIMVKQGDGATLVDSKWGPLIYFDYWGDQRMMEVKLPSDLSQTSVTDGPRSMQYWPASDLGGTQSWNYMNAKLEYKYDASNGEYTLELFADWDYHSIAKWTCKVNGTKWNKVN